MRARRARRWQNDENCAPTSRVPGPGSTLLHAPHDSKALVELRRHETHLPAPVPHLVSCDVGGATHPSIDGLKFGWADDDLVTITIERHNEAGDFFDLMTEGKQGDA